MGIFATLSFLLVSFRDDIACVTLCCMVSKSVSALIIAPRGRLRASLGVLLRAMDDIAEVHESDDAIEGLRAIATSQPSIVLLDVNEPDQQAWSVLRQLKSTQPQIRCCVIVHTVVQEQRARDAGADAVLQAGFSAEALDSSIRGFAPAQLPCADPRAELRAAR